MRVQMCLHEYEFIDVIVQPLPIETCVCACGYLCADEYAGHHYIWRVPRETTV